VLASLQASLRLKSAATRIGTIAKIHLVADETAAGSTNNPDWAD